MDERAMALLALREMSAQDAQRVWEFIKENIGFIDRVSLADIKQELGL